MARIQPTVTISYTKPAPEVAAFSSQGPSAVNPEIIKVSMIQKVQLWAFGFSFGPRTVSILRFQSSSLRYV